jgi:ADP-heptose:LPS heptosyltransferase
MTKSRFSEMKKILFIRSDRLGEFLLSLPAIKLVKANYPESKIYLLAQKSNIELIKDLNFIDYFLEYKEKDFAGFRGAFKLGKILRKEKIDCIVVLNPKKEFHLASYLAGIPLRVGYGRKWGFCLNKKIEDKKNLAELHEVEYNLDLVGLICKNVFVPNINFITEDKTSLEFLKDELEIDKKYLLIHPFSSHQPKRIEDEFWMNLIQRVKSEISDDIIMIGNQEEKEESLVLERKLQIKSLVGKFTLRNLATFLRYNCAVFIGLDSGPLHLASILKVPVVGLFKASNPRRWGPYFGEHLVIEGRNIECFLNKIDDIVNFISDKFKKCRLK